MKDRFLSLRGMWYDAVTLNPRFREGPDASLKIAAPVPNRVKLFATGAPKYLGPFFAMRELALSNCEKLSPWIVAERSRAMKSLLPAMAGLIMKGVKTLLDIGLYGVFWPVALYTDSKAIIPKRSTLHCFILQTLCCHFGIT